MKQASNKPEPVKAEIIARTLAGDSKAKIAKDLSLARGTVRRILRESELTSLDMPALLERHGITGSTLVEKYLKPALDAMETEFAKFKGKIMDSADVIAWGPRLQALEMTLKLLNAYPREDAEKNAGVTFNVVISAPRPHKQLENTIERSGKVLNGDKLHD